jgi:hypothetical protein
VGSRARSSPGTDALANHQTLAASLVAGSVAAPALGLHLPAREQDMPSTKTGAIVISWGAAIPGREPRMLRVLQNAMAFNHRLQEAGRIEDIRLYVAMTGPNRDTIMLLGRLDELAGVLVDGEFNAQVQAGLQVVRDVSIALWAGGVPEAAPERLHRSTRA